MNVLPRGRCLLVPTLHDEPTAYLPAFKLMAQRAREILFLTLAEQRLARKLWGNLPGRVVAMPVETAPVAPAPGLPPFILYCGRIDAAKGCDQLVDFFLRWKQQHPGESAAAAHRRGQDGVAAPPARRLSRFRAGPRKVCAMAAARAFVMPSAWESFSIATLEAMSQGTPALVNGRCEVLADHVRHSRVGQTYHDYDSFCAGLCELSQHTANLQAARNQARNYVLSRYGPERIREILIGAVESTPADAQLAANAEPQLPAGGPDAGRC